MANKNPKLFGLLDIPAEILMPLCKNEPEFNPSKFDITATNRIKNKKLVALSYPKRTAQRLPADNIVITTNVNSVLLIILNKGTSDQKFVDRHHMRYNANNTSQPLLIYIKHFLFKKRYPNNIKNRGHSSNAGCNGSTNDVFLPRKNKNINGSKISKNERLRIRITYT